MLWFQGVQNIGLSNPKSKSTLKCPCDHCVRRTNRRAIYLFICSNMIEHKTILLKQLHEQDKTVLFVRVSVRVSVWDERAL